MGWCGRSAGWRVVFCYSGDGALGLLVAWRICWVAVVAGGIGFLLGFGWRRWLKDGWGLGRDALLWGRAGWMAGCGGLAGLVMGWGGRSAARWVAFCGPGDGGLGLVAGWLVCRDTGGYDGIGFLLDFSGMGFPLGFSWRCRIQDGWGFGTGCALVKPSRMAGWLWGLGRAGDGLGRPVCRAAPMGCCPGYGGSGLLGG